VVGEERQEEVARVALLRGDVKADEHSSGRGELTVAAACRRMERRSRLGSQHRKREEDVLVVW
jgi:hypothetical protein